MNKILEEEGIESTEHLLRELDRSEKELFPQRNARCFCGSQKKYKKCCIEKEAMPPCEREGDIDFSLVHSNRLESFEFASEQEEKQCHELIEKEWQQDNITLGCDI